MSVPWSCFPPGSTCFCCLCYTGLSSFFFTSVCTLFSVLLVDYACIAAGLFPWLLFWISECMYFDFPQKGFNTQQGNELMKGWGKRRRKEGEGRTWRIQIIQEVTKFQPVTGLKTSVLDVQNDPWAVLCVPIVWFKCQPDCTVAPASQEADTDTGSWPG